MIKPRSEDHAQSLVCWSAAATLLAIWIPQAWPNDLSWRTAVVPVVVAIACVFSAGIASAILSLWNIDSSDRRLPRLRTWIVRYVLTVLLVSLCFQAIRSPISADAPVQCEPDPRGGTICH